jgi:FtsH-binding integral membrane protein
MYAVPVLFCTLLPLASSLLDSPAHTQLDFASLYPFLFAGIWGMITASIVQIFLPFNATFDLVIAGFGVVLFSGFILYDTQQIMKRLSVDEIVLAVITIYLDVLNLFLSVLRVVSAVHAQICARWGLGSKKRRKRRKSMVELTFFQLNNSNER